MRILLIDGDDILWRAAARCAGEAALEADLARRLAGLRQALRGDRLVVALSDRDNWRKALWPPYKAHRAGRPRPPLLAPARRILQARWETRSAAGLEADDVLGLAATDPGYLDGRAEAANAPEADAPQRAALRAERLAARLADGVQRVIVSRDKDLMTVPGLHGGADGRIRAVAADEAALAHLALALSGDPADGFKGCPGIGPVRARRLLEAAPPVAAAQWRAVVGAYRRAGLGEAEALLQARLARVLRAGEIDASGRPLLWSPG